MASPGSAAPQLAAQWPGKGKQRLTGWLTAQEWEEMKQEAAEDKKQNDDAAAAQKATAAARRGAGTRN